MAWWRRCVAECAVCVQWSMHGHSTESDSSHNYYMNFFYCKLLTQIRIHNIHVYGQWYFWLQNSNRFYERSYVSSLVGFLQALLTLNSCYIAHSRVHDYRYFVGNDRNQSTFIDLPMNLWVNIENFISPLTISTIFYFVNSSHNTTSRRNISILYSQLVVVIAVA